MANVIKHKRGSGSDPAANNLVLGELAIRTDTGKLFTKMDSGAIAEIAGGGSDIAINTLSSSSATGGGSATFNGSAYRFTLSAPPNVSAAQLLVSINGVVQKPVAGTGQPSEGFSVDGTDIILGDAPATGSDFFILTFKSLGVSEPADDSVTSAKIVDGAIVNADINASAAIAGTKIDAVFGNQDLTVGGTASIPTDGLQLSFSAPEGHIKSKNSSGAPASNLAFHTTDTSGNTNRVMHLRHDGNVGIGTSSPSQLLHLKKTGANALLFVERDSGALGFLEAQASKVTLGSSNNHPVHIVQNSGDALMIDSSKNVGIGTTSPSVKLHVNGGSGLLVERSAGTSVAGFKHTGATAMNIYFQNSGSTNHPSIGSENQDMTLGTNNTERMRINSSGNVLVGLSSTLSSNNAKLQVAHTDGNADIIVHRAGNNANPPSLNFQKTRNASIGNYSTIVQSGDELGSLRWGGADGSNIGFAARIVGAVDGSPGTNDMPGRIQFHTSADGGEDLTERMRIDSSGRLLLGTTTEGHASADDFTVASSASTGITVRSGTSSEGNIYFSKGTSGSDEYKGIVMYDHSNNSMKFYTDTSERMRIDSSGNLKLDANQNISYKVQIGDVSNDNFTSIGHEIASNSGDPIRGFVAQNNNGGIIENLQGSINQFLFLGDTDYQQSDKTLLGVSTNSGSTYYKRLDLSGTGILTIANGIKFNNDTAEANKLDDYEEGTFSPAIRPNSNSNAASMTVHEANYTRVGRLVHVVAYMTINSNPSGTTGGDTRIVGLPFQNIGAHGAANIHYFAGLGNNINFISGTVQGNSTEILIRATTSATTGTSNIAYADYFGANDGIIFSATYQTA